MLILQDTFIRKVSEYWFIDRPLWEVRGSMNGSREYKLLLLETCLELLILPFLTLLMKCRQYAETLSSLLKEENLFNNLNSLFVVTIRVRSHFFSSSALSLFLKFITRGQSRMGCDNQAGPFHQSSLSRSSSELILWEIRSAGLSSEQTWCQLSIVRFWIPLALFATNVFQQLKNDFIQHKVIVESDRKCSSSNFISKEAVTVSFNCARSGAACNSSLGREFFFNGATRDLPHNSWTEIWSDSSTDLIYIHASILKHFDFTRFLNFIILVFFFFKGILAYFGSNFAILQSYLGSTKGENFVRWNSLFNTWEFRRPLTFKKKNLGRISFATLQFSFFPYLNVWACSRINLKFKKKHKVSANQTRSNSWKFSLNLKIRFGWLVCSPSNQCF